MLCLPLLVVAQTPSDSLSFKSNMFGYSYYAGSLQISSASFMQSLNTQPDLCKMFQNGKTMSITGAIIGCVGAYCFGYDLGSRAGGGKGNDKMLIGGGIVTVGGLVLGLIGEGKMKKAVKLYNNNTISMYLETSLNGLCLRVSL
jgi:hypothetical protein